MWIWLCFPVHFSDRSLPKRMSEMFGTLAIWWWTEEWRLGLHFRGGVVSDVQGLVTADKSCENVSWYTILDFNSKLCVFLKLRKNTYMPSSKIKAYEKYNLKTLLSTDAFSSHPMDTTWHPLDIDNLSKLTVKTTDSGIAMWNILKKTESF